MLSAIFKKMAATTIKPTSTPPTFPRTSHDHLTVRNLDPTLPLSAEPFPPFPVRFPLHSSTNPADDAAPQVRAYLAYTLSDRMPYEAAETVAERWQEGVPGWVLACMPASGLRFVLGEEVEQGKAEEEEEEELWRWLYEKVRADIAYVKGVERDGDEVWEGRCGRQCGGMDAETWKGSNELIRGQLESFGDRDDKEVEKECGRSRMRASSLSRTSPYQLIPWRFPSHRDSPRRKSSSSSSSSSRSWTYRPQVMKLCPSSGTENHGGDR